MELVTSTNAAVTIRHRPLFADAQMFIPLPYSTLLADLSASFLRSLLGPSPLPRPAPGPAEPPRARGGPRSRRTPSALFSS